MNIEEAIDNLNTTFQAHIRSLESGASVDAYQYPHIKSTHLLGAMLEADKMLATYAADHPKAAALQAFIQAQTPHVQSLYEEHKLDTDTGKPAPSRAKPR